MHSFYGNKHIPTKKKLLSLITTNIAVIARYNTDSKFVSDTILPTIFEGSVSQLVFLLSRTNNYDIKCELRFKISYLQQVSHKRCCIGIKCSNLISMPVWIGSIWKFKALHRKRIKCPVVWYLVPKRLLSLAKL